MTPVSEAASLALHSMALLAQAGHEKLSVDSIAERTGASRAHLSKVLQRLAKVELVKGVRGPGGGYVLTRPGSEITLLDVYEAIDGPVSHEKCMLQRPECLFESCLFGGFLTRMTREFREYLAQHSLADLDL